MEALARRLAEATGDHATAGGSWFEVFDVPMTAHFLGGVTIGSTPERGVVDAYHRVWGHPGISVVDGSAVSANLGVNPALTITAQAERALALWPNAGEPDPRPSQSSLLAGEGYAVLAPVVAAAPGRAGVPPAGGRWCGAVGGAGRSAVGWGRSGARGDGPAPGVGAGRDDRVMSTASDRVWTFTAPVWRWREGSWRFVTLPEGVSDEVDEVVGDATGGFGSVRVEVTVGALGLAHLAVPVEQRRGLRPPAQEGRPRRRGTRRRRAGRGQHPPRRALTIAPQRRRSACVRAAVERRCRAGA